jgi:hypothetical protein
VSEHNIHSNAALLSSDLVGQVVGAIEATTTTKTCASVIEFSQEKLTASDAIQVSYIYQLLSLNYALSQVQNLNPPSDVLSPPLVLYFLLCISYFLQTLDYLHSAVRLRALSFVVIFSFH